VDPTVPSGGPPIPSLHRKDKAQQLMAIRIRARHGENIGQMMRRFKKLCEKEGLTKDVKRRQYFEKPSERRRRAERKAAQRLTRAAAGKPAPVRRSTRGRR